MHPNPLPLAFDSILRTHAEASGLAEILPKLRIVARPSFNIELVALGILDTLLPSRQYRVGTSRFGGLPDLPATLAWPERDGSLLIFIAQLNFEEIPSGIDYLPKRGRLYFFLGTDASACNIDHAVLYWDGSAEQLVPLDRPPNASFINTEYQHPFRPAAVRFTPTVTLPPLYHDTTFDEHYDALDKLRNRLAGNAEGTREISRLLGHPTDFHGHPEAEAYVVSQGRSELINHVHKAAPEQLDRQIEQWRDSNRPDAIGNLLKLRQLLPWYHDDLPRHEREMAHWQLMLEVTTHAACNMVWWDAGVLQFMIDTRDLIARNFSNTYARIESF